MTSEELRASFLVDGLFHRGQIDLVYVDLDHAVVGSAVPASEPLILQTDPELCARFFTERREIGIINIGDSGVILVDGVAFDLAFLDSLYIGRGCEDISFMSLNQNAPAEYFLLSYPAHTAYPSERIDVNRTTPIILGSPRTADLHRTTRVIHEDGVRSCQLVMGFTEVAMGSAWNTMPPKTHKRRSEIRLYFELKPEDRVLHLIGPPQETRHLIVANKQAVISPPWSINASVGTGSYIFSWGMGGENHGCDDIETIPASQLR
jgi:4-deoxy-L-threo-5-hexosulose-uronate ketol-isomerase